MEKHSRKIMFFIAVTSVFYLFNNSILGLFMSAYNDDTFSYIPLIPFISAYFAFHVSEDISGHIDSKGVMAGILFIIASAILYLIFLSKKIAPDPWDPYTFLGISIVLFVAGITSLIFGIQSLRILSFPLGFLLMIAPIHSLILEPIVLFLQISSAEVTNILFNLIGLPFIREGNVFHLPGINIEVAKECSGIRSSISLFILSIALSHIFLRSYKCKLLLSVSVIPITILKNAVRIVMLSLLAVYVDPRVLDSVIHRRGGIPIFLLALSLLGLVLWILKKVERGGTENTQHSSQ